ncbi:MFS transporter [Lacibacterium aquatile]|uniref:MFS transporter n=1 Tax=Lacibacterium aquatile TaxID=1168082 RepID=A0ABW5DS60_9PROT
MSRFSLPPNLRKPVHSLGATQIVGWGTIYYLPPLVGPILAEQEGWSRTTTFALFSAALIVNALCVRLVGKRIDRYGGRAVMTAGSLLATLGLVVLGLAPSVAVFGIGWALLGAAMAMTLYEPAFASLTAIGGAAARPAITALTLYGGLASTIFWPIGSLLLELVGWRGLCLSFAACNLIICVPLHAWCLKGPAGASARPQQITTEAPLTAIQKKQLFLYGGAFVLLSFVNAAFSAHMFDLLEVLGLDHAMAVTAGSLRGVGQVASRFLELIAGGGGSPWLITFIATALTPVAFLLPWLGLGTVGVFAFSMLYGAANGLLTIARGAVPLGIAGPQRYGEVASLITRPVLVMAALSPVMLAALSDLIGAKSSLMLLSSLTLIAVLLVLAAGRYRKL